MTSGCRAHPSLNKEHISFLLRAHLDRWALPVDPIVPTVGGQGSPAWGTPNPHLGTGSIEVPLIALC